MALRAGISRYRVLYPLKRDFCTLNGEGEAVVGEADVGGEGGFSFFVASHVVA